MAFVILCPIDFSECSRLAVDWVVRMAPRLADCEVTFLHVLETAGDTVGDPEPALEEIESKAARVQELAKKEIADVLGGPPLDPRTSVRYAVVRGKPYLEILRAAAQSNADLVVVGTHGRTGLKRLLLGSVAERVVRGAPCTVVAVKPKEAGFEIPD